MNYEENRERAILGAEGEGLGLRACVRGVVIDGERKDGGKAEVKKPFYSSSPSCSAIDQKHSSKISYFYPCPSSQ